jgi:hypothetical protein
MDLVKTFGLFPRHMEHFQRSNLETSIENFLNDMSCVARANRVGFDNSEGKIAHVESWVPVLVVGLGFLVLGL